MCMFPLSVKSKDAFGVDVNYTVPCGKCLECMKDVQNAWKIRLSEEYRDHLYTYFFTLTYNEQNVPTVERDGVTYKVFDKSHIQKWIKRARINFERLFKRVVDFKYFVCSEYGPNTGRPHFHGIIFTDVSETFISSIFDDWNRNYGYTNWSTVGRKYKQKIKSSASSVGNYVAKYCCKPSLFRSDKEKELFQLIAEGVIPAPWRIMSKGLGERYVSRMKRYHVPSSSNPRERVSLVVDRMHYRDGRFQFKLPRFYKDRLYRKKFPFDVNQWNKKFKCYEIKTVYRYASKNPLALQIQTEVRKRIVEDYQRRVAEARISCPEASDIEIGIMLERCDASLRLSSQKDIHSKLARFYNTCRDRVRSF